MGLSWLLPTITQESQVLIGVTERRADVKNFQVREVTSAMEWDGALVSFVGSAHPLQAWGWGEAKKAIGERIERWMVVEGDRPVLLAQLFEKRVSPIRIRMAWVPRGPVLADGDLGVEAFRFWKKQMALRGYRIAAFQPYRPASEAASKLGFSTPHRREFTYLLDLAQPIETLDKALDKEWRYGKNRFTRDGGVVSEGYSPETLEVLINMLSNLSQRKGFPQYGDADLLRAIAEQFFSGLHPEVTGHLFRAMIGDKIAGCALVLRVGKIAHFNWGAFDYDFRNSRVNEGLQWGIMEQMRELGVATYDLEGADLVGNPGVYHFKRRMGGRLVPHSPYQLSLLL